MQLGVLSSRLNEVFDGRSDKQSVRSVILRVDYG